MIEINPISSLDSKIRIHGSKSFTQRALITTSLGKGTSRLNNFHLCDDSNHMVDALKEFGAEISIKDRCAIVKGVDGSLKLPSREIFVGNAGTAMRFLMGISSLVKGEVTLTCDKQMQRRPIQDLTDALKYQRVMVKTENGYPPVNIKSAGLKGGLVQVRSDKSSQYLSSLLLCGPYAENPLRIGLFTSLTSKPYVDVTLEVMRKFGANVVNKDYKEFLVSNEDKYSAREYIIEGDYSNASYFFAAAAITQGKIIVEGLNKDSLQGDSKFLKFLQQMGCRVEKLGDKVQVEGSNLTGIKADLKDCPDLAPTLAIVAAFAKGKTEISGITNLKFKETNRVTALANELKKINIKVDVQDDKMVITPGKAKSAEIEAYNDHRIAMSFAIAGLKIPKMKIKNPECVEKSFPDFFRTLESLR